MSQSYFVNPPLGKSSRGAPRPGTHMVVADIFKLRHDSRGFRNPRQFFRDPHSRKLRRPRRRMRKKTVNGKMAIVNGKLLNRPPNTALLRTTHTISHKAFHLFFLLPFTLTISYHRPICIYRFTFTSMANWSTTMDISKQ